MNLNQTAGSNNAVTKITTLQSTHETLSSVNDLTYRIEQMADRLLGAKPAEACGQPMEPPDGIIPLLHDCVMRSNSRLIAANEALDRIARELL